MTQEELISRLNAKVTQLKMNEDRLTEELNMLRSSYHNQSELKQPARNHS